MEAKKKDISHQCSLKEVSSLDQHIDLLSQESQYGPAKLSEVTITTQQQEVKTQLKQEANSNFRLDQSEIEDYRSLLKNMQYFQKQECTLINKACTFSPQFFSKMVVSPSFLSQTVKKQFESNWQSHCELKCIVDINGTKSKTLCKIKDAQIHFQKGVLSFRLAKITKIKVLFENNQKCLCFTYDETRAKKTTQIKFKLFVENDFKEDLYVIFSKVIVQKMALLDYVVNPKEKEEKNAADRQSINGELFKKSQFTRQWKQRQLVLTDRIQSFRGQKCTYEMKNIRELWTRFEIFDKCLVVKLRHGIQKTELALPIVNYSVRFAKHNWLYRIYSLLRGS